MAQEMPTADETAEYLRYDDIEKEEITGYSRTFGGVQWLIAILVMLYGKLPGAGFIRENTVLAALAAFCLFIVFFHYALARFSRTRWGLALETWVMIVFITFVLRQTCGVESPLMSLYFLVIIAAAFTLGKNIALLEAGLISACCLLLVPSSFPGPGRASLLHATGPMLQMFPLWLVAYLAAMLASKNNLARKKIRRLSQTDYLTGLWNMKTFFSLLERETRRSERHSHPYAVMMIDADNLKPVNDTYGHDVGSEMIQTLGQAIQRNLRSSDIVARFGGDEFATLLVETAAIQAFVAAERIRKSVAESPLAVGGHDVPITISIGIASFPGHGSNGEELVKKADSALYMSKQNGKNRSTIIHD